MNPTERDLLDRMFDRIDGASNGPRDAEAEALIAERVARNPEAPYRMAQTIAVQDEALKRAEERIRSLEGQAAPTSGSSLAEEAGAVTGGRRSSVPSAGQRPAGFGAGGFLSGAGQVALGIVGGTLLMEGIRGLMGENGAAEAAEAGAGADQAAQQDAGAGEGAPEDGQDYADAGGAEDFGGDDGGGFLDGLFGGGGDFEL